MTTYQWVARIMREI